MKKGEKWPRVKREGEGSEKYINKLFALKNQASPIGPIPHPHSSFPNPPSFSSCVAFSAIAAFSSPRYISLLPSFFKCSLMVTARLPDTYLATTHYSPLHTDEQ